MKIAISVCFFHDREHFAQWRTQHFELRQHLTCRDNRELRHKPSQRDQSMKVLVYKVGSADAE
ncbi:unnamed protein product [Ascophyllum nodosum]